MEELSRLTGTDSRLVTSLKSLDDLAIVSVREVTAVKRSATKFLTAVQQCAADVSAMADALNGAHAAASAATKKAAGAGAATPAPAAATKAVSVANKTAATAEKQATQGAPAQTTDAKATGTVEAVNKVITALQAFAKTLDETSSKKESKKPADKLDDRIERVLKALETSVSDAVLAGLKTGDFSGKGIRTVLLAQIQSEVLSPIKQAMESSLKSTVTGLFDAVFRSGAGNAGGGLSLPKSLGDAWSAYSTNTNKGLSTGGASVLDKWVSGTKNDAENSSNSDLQLPNIVGSLLKNQLGAQTYPMYTSGGPALLERAASASWTTGSASQPLTTGVGTDPIFKAGGNTISAGSLTNAPGYVTPSWFSGAPATSTWSLGGGGTAAGAGAAGVAGVLGGLVGGAIFGNKGYSSMGGSMGASLGMTMATSSAFGASTLGGQLGMAAGPIGAIAGMAIGAALGSMMGPSKKPGVGRYGRSDITESGTVYAPNEAYFYGDRRGYMGFSSGYGDSLNVVGGGISALAKQYGGNAAGLTLGLQTAYSPDGKGADAGTTLSRNGQALFASVWTGANADMEKQAELALQRLLLAGLQQSNLAPEFAKVLDGVNLSSATKEQIEALQGALEKVREVNTAFDGMSNTFPALAKLAWAAREGLVAASGGLDQLTANLSTYYQGYYTETERMNDQQKQMTQTVAALGLVLPDTKEEFRALVESLDLTTSSGQQAYATLIGMSGSFAQWVDAANNAAQDVIDAANAAASKQAAIVTNAFEQQLKAVQGATQRASSALSSRNAAGSTLDSIDKALGKPASFAAAREQQLWAAMQTASLEQQVSLAGELSTLVLERYQVERTNLEELVRLGKGLREYVQGLKVSELSPLTLGEKLAEAASQYQSTLGKAQGGDVTALAALQGMAQTYLQLQREYSASGSDYTSVFDSVTGALTGLGASTQTNAEQQLSVGGESLAQLKELRGVAANAYSMLDRQYQHAVTAAQAEMAGLEALALKTGRLDEVASLLSGLPVELATALQPLLATSNAVGGWYQDTLGRTADAGGLKFWSDASKNMGAEGAKSSFGQVAQNELWLNSVYQSVFGRATDAGGRDFWLAALGNGMSQAEIEAQIRQAKVNGSHAHGLGYVPFDGYVAELHQGERVLTAAESQVYSATPRSNSDSENNAALVAEVRALRGDVVRLQSALVKATGDGANAVASTVAAGAEHVAGSVGQAVSRGAYAASERKVELV